MPTLLSISELAARKGVSKQAVSKRVGRLEAAGLLVTVQQGTEKLVDPEAYERACAATAQPGAAAEAAAGPAAEALTAPRLGVAIKAQDAKAAGAVYDAKLKQLEYERETAKLVERSQVNDAAVSAGRAVRDGIFAAADRLADELATMTEPRAVRARLREALTAEFTRLADDARARRSGLLEGVGDGLAA